MIIIARMLIHFVQNISDCPQNHNRDCCLIMNNNFYLFCDATNVKKTYSKKGLKI